MSVWLRILATKSEGSDPEHIFEIDSPNFVAYAVIAKGSDILLHGNVLRLKILIRQMCLSTCLYECTGSGCTITIIMITSLFLFHLDL